MDNDNKIDDSKLTHKEVALFLGKDLISNRKKGIETYNLEEEYAKTKNNKIKFIWGILALCFAAVMFGTITTTLIVKKSHQKIAINIDTFDDLNLRSLLNMVGHAQTTYDTAMREKKSLEASRDSELSSAEQKKENDLFTLKSISRIISKSAQEKRRAEIEEKFEASVKEIHKQYDGNIEALDKQTKELKKKLTSFESTELSKARAAESSIDSQKQLHDIEIKKLSENYEKQIKELRLELIAQQFAAAEEQKKAVEQVQKIYEEKIDLLDPKAREQNDNQNQIIFDAGIEQQLQPSALWQAVDQLDFDPQKYIKNSYAADKKFVASLETSKEMLSRYAEIAGRFKPIPMENSIKDYVPAMQKLTFQIAESMAVTQSDLNDKIESLKKMVSFCDVFLNRYAHQNNCEAFVIDAGNPDKILVFVTTENQELFEDETEIKAQIGTGKKAMPELTIKKEGDSFFARFNENAQKSQLSAGDKIVLFKN